MKMLVLFFMLFVFILSTDKIYSQEGVQDTNQTKPVLPKRKKVEDKFKEEVPEKMKYFKEKYETDFDAPFEVVFKAVKKAITDDNCMIQKESYSQNEKGLYKGIIRSDACLFTEGNDTTFDVLSKYSVDLPLIRGGNWDNGRMQYKFTINELENGKVHLYLKGDMSGFESHATNQVHFWKSTGYLENSMLERISRLVKENNK